MMPTMPPDAHKIALKLIEAIKQHPVLYISEVKGTAVKLQEFRQKVWKRISDELGLEPGWVRLRWKNLRDTYCRILKHKAKAEKGTRKKKWIFEDHLSFLKFPYAPDFERQCVELNDEYIEEINSGSVNSEDLLEQLEDQNEEDYHEYLEVLEDTAADPILEEGPHISEVTDSDQQPSSAQSLNNHASQTNVTTDVAHQIQSKYRKIRPKKMKMESPEHNTEDDAANDYGILNPNFKIEHLKIPEINSVTRYAPVVTKTSSTSQTDGSTVQDSDESSKIEDQVYLSPIAKTSIELFFDSMAQTVRLLPPKAQAEIKMSVCKIVTEAEVKNSTRRSNPQNTQQFITPPGMIPKLVLIPCSMIDKPEAK